MMTKELRKIEMFEPMGFAAGITERDDWKSQAEVYDAIKRQFSAISPIIVSPRQTHSPDILVLEGPGAPSHPVADGVICRAAGVCITVRTADCIPLLFADPSTGIFGAVHVGWRGMAAGIIEEFFAQTAKICPTVINMLFYLGPSIGKCCFEVGDDVALLFDEAYVDNRNGRFFVDLPGLARNKISNSGVRDSNVRVAPECTFCEEGRFYSYRRDGAVPVQMVSYIFGPS